MCVLSQKKHNLGWVNEWVWQVIQPFWSKYSNQFRPLGYVSLSFCYCNTLMKCCSRELGRQRETKTTQCVRPCCDVLIVTWCHVRWWRHAFRPDCWSVQQSPRRVGLVSEKSSAWRWTRLSPLPFDSATVCFGLVHYGLCFHLTFLSFTT